MRANLRRSLGTVVASASKSARGIIVDEKSKTVSLNGKTLDVSAREYELLRYLTSSPETVFTREEILRSVYGYEYDGGTRIVDVAVRRLREKLEECAEGAGRVIATRHGVGYYYAPQEK